MFTRHSHNLAAPNDAIAGGHQETDGASFARKKKDETEDGFYSLSTPVEDKKKPFYFRFPHPTDSLRPHSHSSVE